MTSKTSNMRLESKRLLTVVASLLSVLFLEVPLDAAGQVPALEEEKTFNQAQKLEELRQSIAGKENMAADSVFKNIQLLKGMPAGRLLRVMEIAYSKSLGVDCTHCHVVDQWEKEDKPTKQIAREMWGMMNGINSQFLKNIKNLKSETPSINCTTCHRGQTKPALNLP